MEYRDFIGGSYQSQATTADAEDTMNWYVERMEVPGATTRAALYPTPGVTSIAEAMVGPGRGHFAQDGREFAVIGSVLYEVGEGGLLTDRGSVAIDANPATINSNGDGGGQLFVTSGGNGYVYDLDANTLTQISALDGKATMGAQLDGYFLALDTNSSTMYVSDLLDGTTWDPTQFAQRSSAPDRWASIIVNNRFIWLLGTQTSEVWYDAGTFPFPFALYPSGNVPYGIAAPFSVRVVDGAVTWLARSANGDGQVLRSPGFLPETISTYPVQFAINGYVTIEDALGDSYSDLGHTFYLLTFPSQRVTWAWDSQSQPGWAKRGTWISEDNEFIAWRPQWHAFAFGEHRMLDSSNGNVYRMSVTIGTDVEDRPIRRIRRGPTLMDENRLIKFPCFELDLEPGLGLPNGQGSNPQVMMRFSKDVGKTWSPEQWRTAGALGEYLTRVRWTRCGVARRMTFEVSVTDPIPWRITNAYLPGLSRSTEGRLSGESQQVA